MSPTKPRPTITRRIIPSTSTTASSIPRRVKPTSSKIQKPVSTSTSTTSSSASSSITTDPKKKSISSKESSKALSKNVSIFSDSTGTLAPTKPIQHFSNGAEANKENMPMTGRASYSASYNRANNGGSPIRTRSGISKKTSVPVYKKKASGRVPLRELSEHEVFERDEAVLGDLRRRRSGEHSGSIIEVESSLAFPSPGTSNANGGASTISSTTGTAPTEKWDERAWAEEVRSLKRSDSEEALRGKLDAILASAATGNKPPKSKVAPKSVRQRSFHPAVRQASPGFSPYRSDASNITSPAKSYIDSPLRPYADSPLRSYADSPLRVRRSPSPIARCSPSPTRPLPRMGLSTKVINTILSEKKLVVTVESKDGEKAKKIIINTSSATGDALKKKKIVTKKAGSSLRRAAGAATAATARDPSRPALALVGGRVTGLEGMRKMR